MLDADAIDPLLTLAEQSPSTEVALSALGAAASFKLTPDAWQHVAHAVYRVIDKQPPGSAARLQALRLGVRIPLVSWRAHLRHMADDPDESDREALNTALVQARDESRIAWVLSRADQDPGWAAQALATLPIERLRPEDLPPAPQGDDPIVSFWLAIAQARLGNTAGLDAVLAGKIGEVPLFWGSPWTAYDAVARVRPLPTGLRTHLLRQLDHLSAHPAPTESDEVRRMREITVWAATGECDAQGRPRTGQRAATVFARSRDHAASGKLKARALQVRRQLPEGWFDGSIGPDALEALVALPVGASPQVIGKVLREANRRAATLAPEAPAPIILGNGVVDLIGDCPIDGPEPVATFVRMHLEAQRPALDDGQLAWLIARDQPAHLIAELTQLSRNMPSPNGQCAVLRMLERAADCQAGRSGGPVRGAGPGAGDAEEQAMIDDMPEQMAMAAPPAAASPAPAASSPSGAMPPAPARREGPVRRPASQKSSGPGARGGARSRPKASATAPAKRATPATDVEERRVNARILYGKEPRRSFVAGADNTIRCWIGLPEADVATASDTIPRVAIPATGLQLEVHLCWRDSNGLEHRDCQPLLLPAGRTARSGDCDLRLHVPEGERFVGADIAFLYQGRVFEAVLLQAFALEPGEAETARDQIGIKVQAARRKVIEIDDGVPVNTVVMSPTAAASGDALPPDAPTLRRFGRGTSQHFDLHQAGKAIAWLNDTLHATQTLIVRKQAAAKPGTPITLLAPDEFDADDVDARSLLLDMARHGTGLFRELCDQGFTDPGERIQIICEDGDDHVPLEFVYDRGYPSPDAQWCKEGLAALKTDAATCPVCQFPGQENELGNVAVLCPYGFWSLRKVIERDSPTSEGAASDPGAARRLLSPMTSVAFASSHLVPEPERRATLKALQEHFDTVLLADDWLQWRRAVKQHPALLMVLPHHGIASQLDYLEIGDESLDEELGKLSVAQIDQRVVNPDGHDPGPIVLLLGCQTARASETGYGDLASRIHRQHASIVLGTLAQILGRHAGPIAREFALTLAQHIGPDDDFGTVMLQVRRRMLARGCLIAMCLVAQGDAQWRIQPRPMAPLHATPEPV